jgi:hypothetical protein
MYLKTEKSWLIAWFVGDHLLLRECGPNGTILVMCVDITVAMAMLLRNSGPYGIIFMTVFNTSRYHVILGGQFSINDIIYWLMLKNMNREKLGHCDTTGQSFVAK